ncbi:MAG: gliding motility-associated C-terminal domain-containing protein [Chitinophagales bacterium]
MKKIGYLLFCSLLLLTNQVRASHVMGADLTFKCVGPHRYQVTLAIYRDCNSNTQLANPIYVHYSSATCGVDDSIAVPLATGYPIDITPICTGQQSKCSGGSSAYGIQKYVYSNVLNLGNYCGNDWVLSWSTCCRNNAISSINNPGGTGFYIEARLNNTFTSRCDNSPTFLNNPIPFFCVGQQANFNHGGSDADGDSLAYSLVSSMATSNTTVSYQNGLGYSATNPVLNSGGFSINPVNGQLTFTPTQSSVCIVKVLVREFRNRVLIGQVEREMQVVIQTNCGTVPGASGVDGALGANASYTDTIPACSQSCFYMNSYSADTSVTLTLTWDSAIAGGTFSTTAGTRPRGTFCWTPTRNDVGIHSFTVTVKDNHCPNPNSNIYAYNLWVVPTQPAGPDKATCQYSTVNTSAAGSGTWSVMTGNPATTTFSNANSPTTTISGFSVPGLYNFIWNTTSACTDTMSVTVTVKPIAGNDDTVCQYETGLLNAIGAGVWSALSSNPAVATITSANTPSTSITHLNVAGNYGFIYTNNGCTDTAFILVKAKPNAGSDKTICQYNTVTMTGAGTGNWSSDAANPATVSFSSNTLASAVVGPFAVSGNYTFYWTNNGCTDTVKVAVTPKPIAGNDDTVCQYETGLLNAIGAGVWSALSSNPAVASITSANTPSTSITNLNVAGNYGFIYTNNGCTDTAFILVKAKPNAGSDKTICQYNVVNMTGAGTGNWSSDAANPAVVSFSSNTLASAVVGPFAVSGNYTFYWTNNGCTDTVKVAVTPKPIAGNDDTVCQYETGLLSATGAGVWSALSTNPAVATITSANTPSTSITNLNVAGNYGFIYTNNGCTDTAFILVKAKPNAGSDKTICQYNTVTMTGAGSGTWSADVANPAVVSFSSNTSASAVVGPFAVSGNYTFYWTNNGCTDTVKVTVTPKPIAGNDDTVCQYETGLLSATGSGVWSALSSNPAVATITSANTPSTSITNLNVAGSYGFIYSNNGCTDTAFILVKAKPNAGSDKTICQYNTVAMTGTGTGNWSADVANPAVVSFSSNTSASAVVGPFAVSGNYTFYWTNNGCSDTVKVTVTSKPIAGNDDTVCQYETGLLNAIGAGVWSALSSNPAVATITSANTPSTSITNLNVAGNYGFIYTNNGCTDTAFILVKAKPNAGSDKTICQYNTVTMTGAGTGTWSADVANPAVVSFSSNSLASAVVGPFAVSGNYTFYWTNNGCTDTMKVTVTPKPIAGNDDTVCQYETGLLSATGSGVWSALSSNPAVATITSANTPSTSITNLNVAGNYGFIYTNNGCTDTAFILVKAKPNAGSDRTNCQFNNIQLHSFGNGVWSAAAANPGATTISSLTDTAALVSGFNLPGRYNFVWLSNGCTDTVAVTINAKPDAGTDQSTCRYATAVMHAHGHGTWSNVSGNPNNLTISNTTDSNATISGFNAIGSYALKWTINGCTDTVTINVISKPNAGADQTVCQFSATNMTAHDFGQWQPLATNPAAINFSSLTDSAALVSGFTIAGIYRFVWSANSCTDTVQITVNTKPNAGSDQVTCQFSTASMSAFGHGRWDTLPGNPATAIFSNINDSAATISGFSASGNYGFIWTVNGCSDTAYVLVKSKPNAGADDGFCLPGTIQLNASGSGLWQPLSTNPAVVNIVNNSFAQTLVNGFGTAGNYDFVWSNNGCSDTVRIFVTPSIPAGPNQTICQFSSTNLQGIGIGVWNVINGNPAATALSDSSLPNTLITGFSQPGNYYYLWQVTGCRDTLMIQVTPKPDAGTNLSICQFESASMQAVGTGTWDNIPGNPASLQISNAALANTTVNGFTFAGTYQLKWSYNGCSDTTLVVVKPKPMAGADQVVCLYDSATLQASGNGTWTILAGNPASITLSNANAANAVIHGLTTSGTYLLQWVVNGCADTVAIQVPDRHPAGPDQTICQYETAVMQASGTGIWSAAPGNPAPLSFSSNMDSNATVSGFTVVGSYALIYTNNGCTDTAFILVKAKPNAGSDKTICQYNTVTMTGSGTGNWSADAANPATVSFSSNTLASAVVGPFAVSGNYTFYWTNNGCTDTVKVAVTPKPIAGNDDTVCQYETGLLNAIGAGVWSALSSNPAVASITSANTPSTSITNLNVAGNYGFIYTNNGCTDTAFILVKAKPNAGSDKTICQYNTIAMTGAGTGNWSADAANPATVSFSSNTSASAVVGPFAVSGNYTFYWTNNGCSDTVKIAVTAKPIAGNDDTVCQYETGLLSATGTGVWSALSTNPAVATITSANTPSTSITNLNVAGNYSFIYTNNGCTDTAFILVKAKPNAGSDKTICVGSTALMNAHGLGSWSAVPGNPTTNTFSSSSDSSSMVYGFNQSGVYQFEWLVNGCSDTVMIQVLPNPNAGTDQTICQYSTTNLQGTGTGVWSVVQPLPAGILFGNTTDSSSTVSGFSLPGNYFVQWTNNGCADTAAIYVTAKPDAGADQGFCLSGVITTQAHGIGSFSALPNNPAITTFSNPNDSSTIISNFTLGGIYQYQWYVNGCYDTMAIEVTPQAPAGSDQIICQYETTQMQALGHGVWSAMTSNPATVTFSNTNDSIALVNGFTAPGQYALIWSVNGCTDTINVNVTPKPNAGADFTTCQFTTPQLQGIGNGQWDTLPGNPSAVFFSNPSLNNTTTTSLDSSGQYRFVWSVNGCTDTVTIFVTSKPQAGADQTICQYQSTNLAAQGNGMWLGLSGNPAAVSFVNTTSPVTGVSGFTLPGNYHLQWTVNGCADTVAIHVNAKPDAGTDQTICQHFTTQLHATGAGQWDTIAGNPARISFSQNTSPTSTASGFDLAGNYRLTWTNNSCSDTVVIHVTPKPNAGPNQVICQFNSTSLQAVGSGNWQALLNNPSVVLPTNNNAVTTIGPFNVVGTYGYIWQVNGCNDTAFVQVNAKPNAGNDQLIPISTNTQMTASGSGSWNELPTNPLTVSFADNTNPTSGVSGFNAIGNYEFEWIVNGCPDSVLILVKDPPAAGNDTSICLNTAAILPGSGNGTWVAASTNPTPTAIANPTALQTAVTGFTAVGTYFFYLNYPGLPSDTIKITVNELPELSLILNQATCTLPTGSAQVQSSGGLAPYSYQWNTGSTTDSVANQYYNTFVSVTVTDSRQCKNTDTGTITTAVVYLPISADSVLPASCHDSSDGAIGIHPVSTYHYQWSNGATTNTLQHLAPGTYALTVSDGVGCFGIDSFKILNPPAAVLQLLPSDTSISEDKPLLPGILFSPYPASSITSYQWTPSTGLSCADCASPQFTGSAGTYYFQLNITYNNGCAVSDSMRVVVISDHLLYIPNAFSPNGDGSNDLFQVYTKNVRFYHLQLFNRWGEKVYDGEDAGTGWDGHYKGALQEPGVYVYDFQVVYNDGFETHQNGSVTLVR